MNGSLPQEQDFSDLGFEFYIGPDYTYVEDSRTHNKNYYLAGHSNTRYNTFEYSINEITDPIKSGSYVKSGNTIGFIEFIYVGKASIFDNGITLRTVNENYTFRMTNFTIANGKGDDIAAGNCYTVDSRDTTVHATTSEESRYKLVYIDDVRDLFTSSAIDNSTFGGYTFAKVDINEVSTEINIDSYLYTLKANGSIDETRHDPIATGSWFNGHTLSEIDLNYYSINRGYDGTFGTNGHLTKVDYKDCEGTITRNFFGNSYNVVYTEIEGYSLTSIDYLGTMYYIGYDANKNVRTDDSGNVVIQDASKNAKTLPESIQITYLRDSNSTYGAFTLTICADSNTFQTNNIKFYSSPLLMVATGLPSLVTTVGKTNSSVVPLS